MRGGLLPSLLLLLCVATSAAAEEPTARDARLTKAVQSPLKAARWRGVDEALDLGRAAVPLARRWAASPSVHARVAGWHVLAHHGTADDVQAAVKALDDAQPAVAAEAADALLVLGGRLAPGDEPWLSRAAAPEQGTRVLARAIVTAMHEGPRNGVAPQLLALGEGVVPALCHIVEQQRYGTPARAGALRALAAIGGTESRSAIANLVTELQDERWHPLWNAWWRALNEVGSGNGLAPAQALAVKYAKAIDFNPWRGPMRRLHWRDRQQYFRFLGQCPPVDGVEYVRGYLEWLIEQASENARRRLFPSLAASIIRAYLVVCEPSEEMLRHAVLCALTLDRRGWQRRAEELGEVLRLLAPYRDRPGVQEGLKELLEEDDLPKTVRAWALHLKGDTPRGEMVKIAEALIDAEGAAATLAQRRLGARLLDDLGVPSVQRIRRTVQEIDGTLHGMGLSWAVRCAAAGRFPQAEADQLLVAALEAEDDGVFLVAAERMPDGLDDGARARLLELAVRGARGVRGRAWRVVERALDTDDGTSGGFVGPGGHAPLDARLRAAARARTAWAGR